MSDLEPIHLVELASALTEPLAEGDADPSGGPASAVVAALAAALAAAAADQSRAEWEEAAGARAQAQALRRRALQLARADAHAYAAARGALAQRGEGTRGDGPDPYTRDIRIGESVRLAATLPLRIAATAADIAQLAGEIAIRANPEIQADATIAATLAAAAARAAAHLVEVNLVAGADEQFVALARGHAHAAANAAESAAQRS